MHLYSSSLSHHRYPAVVRCRLPASAIPALDELRKAHGERFVELTCQLPAYERTLSAMFICVDPAAERERASALGVPFISELLRRFVAAHARQAVEDDVLVLLHLLKGVLALEHVGIELEGVVQLGHRQVDRRRNCALYDLWRLANICAHL